MRPKYKSFTSIFGMAGGQDDLRADNEAADMAGPTHFRHAVTQNQGAQKAAHVLQPIKLHQSGTNVGALRHRDETASSEKQDTAMWRGKSGELYQLVPQKMEKLYFDDKVIVLARPDGDAQKALWVGNVSDIVCEPLKREVYKKAANEATVAYKIVSTFPASDMAGTIWDVEQGALA